MILKKEVIANRQSVNQYLSLCMWPEPPVFFIWPSVLSALTADNLFQVSHSENLLLPCSIVLLALA